METFLPGDEQEKKLIKVLQDMEKYRDQAVLVGGWLPYMYANYLWKLKSDTFIIKTVDIDFALRDKHKAVSPLILEKFLESPEYVTQPVYPGEDTPFEVWVLYGTGKTARMRIDFLSDEFSDPSEFQKKLLGPGMSVIPLDTVDFMLKKNNWLEIPVAHKDRKAVCNILNPSAYLFIKGMSFAGRSIAESDYKYKKDMWSLYFILDAVPPAERENLFSNLQKYRKEEKEYYRYFSENIREYFTGQDAKGVADLTSLLKTTFPERIIKKRIEKKFKELADFLEL
ncbi:MAG: hypothetical protein JW969_15300 [Spirochaetales bacterium]|nr:hypothetical protein [Spirochaetales bacterium]